MHAKNERFVIGPDLPLDADLLVIPIAPSGQPLGPATRALERYPALAEATVSGQPEQALLSLPEGLFAIVVSLDPDVMAKDGGLAVTGRLLSGFKEFMAATEASEIPVSLWIAMGHLDSDDLGDAWPAAVLDALERSALPGSERLERINLDSGVSGKDPAVPEIQEKLEKIVAVRWPDSGPGVESVNTEEPASKAGGSASVHTARPEETVPFPDGAGIHSDVLLHGTARRDALDARGEAAVFAKVLARRDLSMPLSIGLFGRWGSGKSFFMDLIREEMDQVLATQAPGNVGRVVHIPFNAWHYVDTNLWASLSVQVFDTLASELGGAQDLEREKKELRKTLHSSRQARGRAQAQLRLAEERRAEISQDLELKRSSRKALARQWAIASFDAFSAELPFRGEISHARATAERMDVDGTIDTIDDAARIARDLADSHARLGGLTGYLVSRFNGPLRFLFTTTLLLLLLLLVSLVPGGLKLLAGQLPQDLAILITHDWTKAVLEGCMGLGAMLANFGMHSRRVRGGIRVLEGLRERFEAVGPHNPKIDELEAKIERLDAEIASHEEAIEAAEQRVTVAQRALQRIQDGELVYEFSSQRAGAEDYTGELGIISTVRKDFMHLKDLLDHWTAKGGRGRPVDRIVLYIDDLDRCSHAQVVEVLQAVHLLLAMPLFVVVVGVDPRWLKQSLTEAYTPGPAQAHRGGVDQFDPQQFLEKIFHIPYSISGMEPQGFRKLIEDLTDETATAPGVVSVAKDPDPMEEILERELNAIAREPGERERKPGLFSRMFGGGDKVDKDDERVAPTLSGPVDGAEDSPMDPTIASGTHPGQTSTPAPGTPPLARWEIALMGHLGPLITTPRTAKRLLNLYLLIRVRAATDEEHFARFIDRESGHYRAVLPLLGLTLNAPADAPGLLAGLARCAQEDDTDLAGFLERTAPPRAERVHAIAHAVSDDPDLEGVALPASLTDYAPWAAAVGRFSFHWHLDPKSEADTRPTDADRGDGASASDWD